MNDLIGSSHMIQGNLTSFIEDRFGCLNSSLALNGGWIQVPSGIYFDSPEFTISVWVYPMNVGYFSRIIDFGVGANADNILLTLSNGNSLLPYFNFFIFRNDAFFDEKYILIY